MGEPEAWLLAAVLFPAWCLVGSADWACHRATRIESTSGLRENLLHWVMFGEIGLLVASMALLRINAGSLALVAALWLVHEATVWIDLRYTVSRREVRPVEQMVHSFQEVFPLLALALLASIAWDQARAMVGLGPEPAEWRLRWKDPMLPPALLAGGAAMAFVCNVLLLAQETWACLRARHPH